MAVDRADGSEVYLGLEEATLWLKGKAAVQSRGFDPA
jgi:hypothetical protein